MTDDSGNERITLADIAEATGVSKMTVSLALRNHPRISEKTRERVRRKAAELGYSPDPLLSALVSYRHARNSPNTQAAIAWINPFRDPKRQHIFDEYELYWKGAAKCAKQYGYRLEEFPTMVTSLQRMNTIFKTRNIRGILIAPMCAPKYRDPNIGWNEFPWEEYATVRFGRNRMHPESHFVSSAQARNTIIAFQNIRAKGYQRIGFIGLHTPTRVFCMGAFYEQVKLPQKQRVPPLLFTLEDSEEKRMKLLDRWLRRHQPDAILTDTSHVAEMLAELGVRAPRDVGIATTSISDTTIDAGIDQNPEEVGRAAVRVLAALLHEQSFGIPAIRNETLIEGKWIDGASLPERNGVRQGSKRSVRKG